MAARRAPRPEERGKAAELTRERILRAAVSEFGEKGYSGARTAGIAARAGVNQQLISYYFGGKQGLLAELRRRRQAEEASSDAASASFAESVAAQLERTLDDPEWARLVVWQALGDCPFADAEEGQRYAQAHRARMAESLERMRGRQEAGQVTGRVDAAFALLVTYAVVFAPITMPQFVRDIFGDDPLSPEVRRRLHGELVRLLGEAEE
ncbi:TetR/AcrR family transcriptional regulator [Nonomuraea jabiensis]|uniref:TetR/AcrR family transcriptional regulator n=1 Tax=Nonomuraea jabiensis TaxID=882448 RepID=UPI00367E03B2